MSKQGPGQSFLCPSLPVSALVSPLSHQMAGERLPSVQGSGQATENGAWNTSSGDRRGLGAEAQALTDEV